MKKLLMMMGWVIAASSVFAQLPDPGFTIDENTAIVITDPQNDFLSPDGATWGLVGKSVVANNTVDNIETLFKLGEKYNIPVFISPHYYYPTDYNWEIEGALEVMMHSIKMFDRTGALSTTGLEGSGADWLEQYKKYINSDNVIVASPHKVFGPESNDLALQLRKRKIDNVILAGMSANLCTESHMRDFIEDGFRVAVVSDATAAAQIPDAGIDGYAAAMVNFRMISSHVYSTAELKKAFETKEGNSK